MTWLLALSGLQVGGLLAAPFVVCTVAIVVLFLLDEHRLRGSALSDVAARAERQVAHLTRPHGCGVEPVPMRRRPKGRC